MKLDMEQLDLSKTLAESLRVVSGRADDKHLSLDADIDGSISVVADRRAVKQIIVNLLSNAVKFTPDGGKVVVRSRLLGDFIVLIDRRHRHRHRAAFAAAAGPAVRAGREPAHQDLSRLRAGAGDRAVADQSARRLDEAALEARHRHRGLRLAAARRPQGQGEDVGGGFSELVSGLRQISPNTRRTSVCGLPDPRLQRGKVRRIAGPRHHAQQVFARGFRLEFFADAEPQDLGQVMIEPRRRTQDLRRGLRAARRAARRCRAPAAWRRRESPGLSAA